MKSIPFKEQCQIIDLGKEQIFLIHFTNIFKQIPPPSFFSNYKEKEKNIR